MCFLMLTDHEIIVNLFRNQYCPAVQSMISGSMSIQFVDNTWSMTIIKMHQISLRGKEDKVKSEIKKKEFVSFGIS